MKRTKEEAEITRQTVMEAALKVFSRMGYATARLEDIAEEAGVTRGAIYHHFSNKRDLYLTMLEEMWMRVMPVMMSAVDEGGTPLQILRRSFGRKLRYAEEDELWRAINELYLLKTALLPELEEALQKKRDGMFQAFQMIEQIICQAIEQGEVRPDVDARKAAIAYYGLQDGLLALWLMDPTQFSLTTQAEASAEIFIRGIATNR